MRMIRFQEVARSWKEMGALGQLVGASHCAQHGNNFRFGRREIDELRHAGGMLVAEVAVNFHRQRAAVFVAEPSGDGRNVNAALNAAGGE